MLPFYKIQIVRALLAVWLLLVLFLPPIADAADGDRGLAVAVQTREGEILPLYADSFALVIGASQYVQGWPDLPGVIDDVQRIQSALSNQGFKVQTVINPDSALLRNAIQDFIIRHGSQLDHRLLIYFAGHGHTLTLAYGEEMGYILPVDTPDPNVDPARFYAKAMDMQQIEVYAKRIQSKHVLFVFDSCFSGSIFSLSRAIPESISYKTAKPVRQFLTSGGADEAVPDKSVFAQQFVNGLHGEADINQDGYITGTELGEFLQDSVVNYTRGSQHPQYGKIRNPMLDKGDFVFVNAAREEASSDGQDQAAPAADMQTGRNFELLFWQSIKDAEDPQMFAAYLEKYPQGTFTALARLNIERLERQSGDNLRADGHKPSAIAAAPAKPPRPDHRDKAPVRRLAIYPGFLDSDAVGFSQQDGRILKSDERRGQFRRITARMWEATKRGLQNNPSLQLRYSFYSNDYIRSLGDVTLIDRDFERADRKNIWKISAEKTWEPDVQVVCRHAHTRGIELVLLHKIKREKLQRVFAVYMVDVNLGTIRKYQRVLDSILDMEPIIDTAIRPCQVRADLEIESMLLEGVIW